MLRGRFYLQIAPKGCYPQGGQIQAVIFQRDILQAMFGFKIQFFLSCSSSDAVQEMQHSKLLQK